MEYVKEMPYMDIKDIDTIDLNDGKDECNAY